MESPTISRSTSATFAPNRGRRSHTNVHHLSLAPLTPKYPVEAADYDAYFDPQTSQLHTATSLTQVSGLPSPGGILTGSPARSRANSRTRPRKKNKSSVSIQTPAVPSGALTSEGFGERSLRVQTETSRLQNSASWLVQTGLTLTEGSRESKGQSWIVKRDSSVSLHTADEQPRSGRATPRSRSLRRSRKSLAMTPAMITPVEDTEPMWAENTSQSEDEIDDAYGELDFEDNFSDDEEEVRKAISRYKLGQWMDNWVDVMLKLEDDAPEDELLREHSDVEVEPPPVTANGLWEDVTWFGRLIARTIRS